LLAISGKAKPAGDSKEFPTILIAGIDDRLAVLGEDLRLDGYLVLEAPDLQSAVHIAMIHFRQIHVPLVHSNVHAPNLAEKLGPFHLGDKSPANRGRAPRHLGKSSTARQTSNISKTKLPSRITDQKLRTFQALPPLSFAKICPMQNSFTFRENSLFSCWQSFCICFGSIAGSGIKGSL
jgi:hypothetical protein